MRAKLERATLPTVQTRATGLDIGDSQLGERFAAFEACQDGNQKFKTGTLTFASTLDLLSDCDAPLTLVNATFDWLEQHWKGKVDFVVWTGDNARHGQSSKGFNAGRSRTEHSVNLSFRHRLAISPFTSRNL